MTPEERQLITGLFERMQGLGPVQKDREADQLIADLIRRFPDAPYLLVQSALIQENALQQGEDRIRELREKVDDLERQVAANQQSQPQQSGSGSFLGGLFGAGASRPAVPPQRPMTGGSVPSTGRPAAQFGAPPPPQNSPWGNSAPQYQGQPQGGQPWGQTQAPAGGGFLRQAATTAAGVAGGMLVANAIGNMFGHHTAQAMGLPTEAAVLPPAVEAHNDQQQVAYNDDNNDPGTYDPSNDTSNVADTGNDPGYDDNDPGTDGGDWGGDGGDGGGIDA